MGSNSPEDPRVWFAIERTLLAWVRTGLALMGFGFVVARFGLELYAHRVTQAIPDATEGATRRVKLLELVFFRPVFPALFGESRHETP
jgi:uncharacterized membrane protein YidH (DUF202 family)